MLQQHQQCGVCGLLMKMINRLAGYVYPNPRGWVRGLKSFFSQIGHYKLILRDRDPSHFHKNKP